MFDTLLGLVGLIIGICSLIIGIRSIIQSEPQLRYVNFPEIRKPANIHKKIKFYYDNQEINQVTTTKICFWNKGRKPIKREDVVQTAPLRLQIVPHKSMNQPVEILDYSLLQLSDKNSKIILSKTDKPDTLQIDFEYVEFNEGADFEIQHTGDVESSVNFSGVILGPKKEIAVSTASPLIDSFRNNWTILSATVNMFAFIIGLLFVAYMIAVTYGIYSVTMKDPWYSESLDMLKDALFNDVHQYSLNQRAYNLLMQRYFIPNGIDSAKAYNVIKKVADDQKFVHENTSASTDNSLFIYLFLSFAFTYLAFLILKYFYFKRNQIPKDLENALR
jgi:hypothetical protein